MVRALVANFANVSSEFANQLAARADALLAQVHGDDRRELPLSVYLQNSTTTDFLNLYIWNRAVAPALIEDMVLHPTTAFSQEETTDRVRVVERLFTDLNWSKVNTVYASGQGDVKMAFIKDDIGNWSLKSFENDPQDLLNAYKQVGLAAVKQAASLAKDVGTGGGTGAATNLLSLANKVSFGSGGAKASNSSSLNVAGMRTKTRTRLEAIAGEAKKKDGELVREIEKAKGEENAAATDAHKESRLAGEQVGESVPPLASKELKRKADTAFREASQARLTVAGLPDSVRGGLAKDYVEAVGTNAEKAENNSLAVLGALKSGEPSAEDREKLTGTAELAATYAKAAAGFAMAASKANKQAAFIAQQGELRRAYISRAAEILKDHRTIVDALLEAETRDKKQ